MTASDVEDSRALEVLRTWQWLFYGPDGYKSPVEMGLGEAVSRLALEGVPNAHRAMLRLLCRNEVTASGFFRWRKYQWGNYYSLEGSNEVLVPNRWQVLADAISEEAQALKNHEFPASFVNLEKLELTDCDIYEWAYLDNRFSTAICPPETASTDRDYFEEWYSAWDISIYPRFPAVEDFCDDDSDVSTPVANRGGRPAVADWESAALEIAGRYYRGDLKPKTIADVSRELAGWLGSQDVYPSDSAIRLHAKGIFDAFQSWERD
ncbi:hypothetical protein [Sphingopyxis sp. P8]|uniref:hypothetical protein n=1 Tax=Sphingopyxis sp. P8 TaxID=2763256 RepID=UPI001D0B638B|nr:hypothetical protein [Sphingopyxis sp. P8]